MQFEEDVYRDQLYTEEQSRLLTLLPRLTAPLSMVGSSIIIYIIAKDYKRKIRRLYHRILLIYSSIDVICSFNYALSALVVPSGTPGVWGARGTFATCAASGFITQFSFPLGVYATFICMYYVLVLRYNVSEQRLKQSVEPIVHTLALLTPLIIGSIMLSKDTYNPTNVVVGWCFINVYPMDCLRRTEIDCERGEDYRVWLLINNVPFILFFVIVATSSILTYTAVSDIEKRGDRWSATRSRQSLRRVRESRTQAFSYIASFFLTYITFGIGTIANFPATEENRGFYFPVVILIKIFLPMQGVWNCIIYIRPRFVAVRSRNRNLSTFSILKKVLDPSEDMTLAAPRPFGPTPSMSLRGLFPGLWSARSGRLTGPGSQLHLEPEPRHQSQASEPNQRQRTTGPSSEIMIEPQDDFMPELGCDEEAADRIDDTGSPTSHSPEATESPPSSISSPAPE